MWVNLVNDEILIPRHKYAFRTSRLGMQQKAESVGLVPLYRFEHEIINR